MLEHADRDRQHWSSSVLVMSCGALIPSVASASNREIVQWQTENKKCYECEHRYQNLSFARLSVVDFQGNSLHGLVYPMKMISFRTFCGRFRAPEMESMPLQGLLRGPEVLPSM